MDGMIGMSQFILLKPTTGLNVVKTINAIIALPLQKLKLALKGTGENMMFSPVPR